MENAIGSRLPRRPGPWDRLAPPSVRDLLYRLALERGYLDAWLNWYIVTPFCRVFRWCDAMERNWTDFLAGEQSRETDQVKPYSGMIEELS
jgi:NAD(P)H-quinone oxidoreductase subunit 5